MIGGPFVFWPDRSSEHTHTWDGLEGTCDNLQWQQFWLIPTPALAMPCITESLLETIGLRKGVLLCILRVHKTWENILLLGTCFYMFCHLSLIPFISF